MLGLVCSFEVLTLLLDTIGKADPMLMLADIFFKDLNLHTILRLSVLYIYIYIYIYIYTLTYILYV